LNCGEPDVARERAAASVLKSTSSAPRELGRSVAKGILMACRGVHFALTEEQRSQLLAIVESQGDVIGFIQEDIEELWDTEWLCETDKAWDAIHPLSY
tara:strand:+ start:876 stop:1169 length:294 start_codon:yes stop_codon:yes gene_type:complete